MSSTHLLTPQIPGYYSMQSLLRGYVKEQVHQPPMPQAIANVAESQLRRTWEQFEYRVDVCKVTNGEHIEHFQKNFRSFHAVLKLFHICICKSVEGFLIAQIIYNIPVFPTLPLFPLELSLSYCF
jgi:hypothetical protein